MVKVCQLVIAQEHAACFAGNRQCVNAFETCQGMSLRFDEITFQAHPLHALQSYKKNQNCFYHPEIVCWRQKKV